MLKKKKKAKTNHSPPAQASTSAEASNATSMAERVAESASAVAEKILESSATAPVVAAAAVAVGVASA